MIPELIPAWWVALSWLYAGFIWIATRGTTIRLDSSIWGVTFILTGLMYLSAYIPSPSYVNQNAVEVLQFRIYFTRILMLLLSTSMWLPLTVSYYRMVRRGELDSNGSTNSSRRVS